ncbi:MAG: hypothetical protein KIT33_07950 [Candidatus Kapabacteria bacterium]|nr:hypothetical protein [Candidatus Kapabacteria bacterium]MBX3043124.1 hypothetical protein [Ignavibacteriota bacterium]MCW5884887.1 hypothetical protein [Candidatus Kapabacteria bacterium]
MQNAEAIERLTEIKEQMLELLEEAKDLLPEGMTKERAKCYWYAHIKTAILKEHEFLGGSLLTVDDTISELGEDSEEDE